METERDGDVREPHLGARVRYYLGFRLPVEYREWVEKDIASDQWAKRGGLIAFVVLVAILLLASAMTGDPWVLRLAAVPVLLALFFRYDVMGAAFWTGQRYLWRHHRLCGLR